MADRRARCHNPDRLPCDLASGLKLFPWKCLQLITAGGLSGNALPCQICRSEPQLMTYRQCIHRHCALQVDEKSLASRTSGSCSQMGLRGDCDFVKRVSNAGRGNDRVRKAKRPAFHPSHTPWKSLRDYHIPTASTVGVFQGARA
jgi:hypothetical protein